MTNETLAPPRHLNTDRFVIRSAVTAIRNAFTQVAMRQPLSFGPGERRAAARIELRIPVHLTAALVKRNDVWTELGFGSSMRATCLDISLTGVGMSHPIPLSSGVAIVRFDIPAENAIYLVVKSAWTNTADDGSCISGARILGVIDGTIDNSGPIHSG
jgi:hypothetical protein